jgi:hypothetical protein
MADLRPIARRLVVTLGIAAAFAVPLTVGAPSVVRTTADPPNCTRSSSGGSLNCAPQLPSVSSGAPNLENGAGTESQEHSGHHH